MKKEQVPQDDNATYRGYGTKVIYALDETGAYTTVNSSGWAVEEVVLKDVVEDFKTKAREAMDRIRAGQSSPIEYFMHLKFLDPSALATGVGMARWRVKRHLKPGGFKRLDPAVLARYADFFNIAIQDLTEFKERFDFEQRD